MEILNQDNILRRVPTYLPDFFKPDGSVTSAAFKLKRDEDGLSVDLARLSTFSNSILDKEKFKLFQLNVGDIRSQNYNQLDVVYNNKPENNAHCLIVGDIKTNDSRKMARTCVEVFE